MIKLLTHDMNWVTFAALQHLHAGLQELPVAPLIKAPLVVAPKAVHAPVKEIPVVDIPVLEVYRSDA